MRLTTPISTGRGRLGSTIFTVVRGVQLARQYQPVVFNPSTARQRASRELFKTAVRTSKALAPAIEIGYKPSGLVSSRNVFVKRFVNIHEGMYAQPSGGSVQITWPSVKFSDGDLGVLLFNQSPQVTSQDELTVTVTNLSSYSVTDPEVSGLGIVLVYVFPDYPLCFVNPLSERPTGPVSKVFPQDLSGLPVQVYAFAKKLLPSNNTIATGVYPWKYPSATSQSLYLGSVTLV